MCWILMSDIAICIGSLSRGKVAGTWRWLPSPSSAEVRERVELYLYSFPGLSWSLIGRALPFYLTSGRHRAEDCAAPTALLFCFEWLCGTDCVTVLFWVAVRHRLRYCFVLSGCAAPTALLFWVAVRHRLRYCFVLRDCAAPTALLFCFEWLCGTDCVSSLKRNKLGLKHGHTLCMRACVLACPLYGGNVELVVRETWHRYLLGVLKWCIVRNFRKAL
jgi:hypothetical protein